jgi:DNA topoisomerase II
MQIYSLTSEKVERLNVQRKDKEEELKEFLKLSAKDLWNHDLDDLAIEWENVLEDDQNSLKADGSSRKKKPASKFAKASRKRVSDAADGEYLEKKPKVAKTKANSTPTKTTQSKITSFASKPTEPKGAKSMHTAAFTSVNKAGFTLPKKEDISKATPIMSIDDDDEFEALIKGIRPEQKPTTIDLLSPSTAVKPKKTFTIPGLKKPSTKVAPKPRAVSKSKAPKRKVESEDEDDSFAFMADDKPVLAATGERRPARAAASKARAIVLTSDDVYDELDDGADFDEDDDEEEE